uniref:C6 domain-containing protein n=1 Tax=Haemonchus contortus TaxID=6289 RepID=A0A7I4YZ74_HAECO
MSLPLLTFFSLFTLVSALYNRGCSSCELATIEELPHSGKTEVEKIVGENGCLIQRTTCRANKPDSETFVQFNHRIGGFTKRGDQKIDIECTNEGHWRFERNGHSIIVESLSCTTT